MSNEVSTSFARRYEPMFQMLAQQTTSYFKDKVRLKTVADGESWSMDQLGAVGVTEITGQRQAISLSDTPHQRRLIEKRTFYFADTVEEQDLTKLITDPTSDYTKNGLMALERRLDQLILDAALGSAKIGKDGGTTVTFAADTNGVSGAGGQTVAAATTGLTYAKLLEIRKKFHQRNVFPTKICLAIGPDQEEDLLNTTQFTNGDFRSVKPLDNEVGKEGYIGSFMEFEIYRTNQLAESGGTRSCIAWDKDGLGAIVGIAPKVILENRPDLAGSPLQVQVVMQAGASRLDGDKVIQVDCVE